MIVDKGKLNKLWGLSYMFSTKMVLTYQGQYVLVGDCLLACTPILLA